jgi:hypothetical protein
MTWNLLIASVAVIFSIISYLLTRHKELAWKRTEFLCGQAQYLDTDPDLVDVLRILEDRHPSMTVAQIFDDDSQLDDEKRGEYRQKFDKLLNLLWRLCYAYMEVRTLSEKEVEGFGWYFWRVSNFPTLVEYCENNGFEDINTVTRKLGLDQDE